MRIPIGEREISSVVTKYATDSSVSITADYSSRRDQVASSRGDLNAEV